MEGLYFDIGEKVRLHPSYIFGESMPAYTSWFDFSLLYPSNELFETYWNQCRRMIRFQNGQMMISVTGDLRHLRASAVFEGPEEDLLGSSLGYGSASYQFSGYDESSSTRVPVKIF